MLGVWYPFDLIPSSAGVPWWITLLVIVAFVLGGATAIWFLRGR
jgi:hypothetical protein